MDEFTKNFEKYIKEKVGKALEKCFEDAMLLGQGYIKVIYLGEDFDIKHIPLEEIESELNKAMLIKNQIKKYSEMM